MQLYEDSDPFAKQMREMIRPYIMFLTNIYKISMERMFPTFFTIIIFLCKILKFINDYIFISNVNFVLISIYAYALKRLNEHH